MAKAIEIAFETDGSTIHGESSTSARWTLGDRERWDDDDDERPDGTISLNVFLSIPLVESSIKAGEDPRVAMETLMERCLAFLRQAETVVRSSAEKAYPALRELHRINLGK